MVRCFGLALICGCCCWLAGCQAAKSAKSSPISGQAANSQEQPANSVELYTAFIERPLGEPFLNNDLPNASCLWSSTDHHVVNFERLEENGYRAGQIVGSIPTELMKLLNSERACVNPRYRLLPCGEPAVLHLGRTIPTTTFKVKNADQSETLNFDQARYCLNVIASLTADGRTKLEFTPLVEHRASAFPIDLAADLSGYVKQAGPPRQSFPLLGWHVMLKPGETLVIGANLEKPDTLGYRSFTQEGGVEPVQRVLVLRTSRPLAGGE